MQPDDLHSLPPGLPVPDDDGATDHLPGSRLPSVLLPATDETTVDLSSLPGLVVIFAYPRTGRPGDAPLVPDWDLIPGARGCTPQTCSFRDLHAEFQKLGCRVFGLSAQDTSYQREMVERLHVPFPVLSDARLELEVVQRVCTSVGGLGTFAALIFVVRQFNLLRAQSDFVQKNVLASLDGQLYARLDSFNKFVVEHDAEYDLLGKPFAEGELSGHRARLHHLCDLGFTFYEQIYKYHVRYDLVDTEDWEEWQRNLAHFFAKPYVRGYWQATRDRYARSFQAFAGELIARTEPPGPQGGAG